MNSSDFGQDSNERVEKWWQDMTQPTIIALDSVAVCRETKERRTAFPPEKLVKMDTIVRYSIQR